MKKIRIQCALLTALSFLMGLSQFIIVGILNNLSNSFHTSIDHVGVLVTLFAIVYAIMTPIINLSVGHAPLYKVLIILFSIFAIGNMLTAVANNFNILLLSRLLTALASGPSMSIAITLAAAITPPQKRSWIVSWVFSGFSIASVFGVPFGTWISKNYGWRYSFYAIILVSIIILFFSILLLPKNIHQQASKNFKEQLRIFGDRRIQIGMFLPMFNLAGIYVFYTYLQPILSHILLVKENFLTLTLFLYGLMALISNQLSGKISSSSGLKKMPEIYIGQFLLLVLFPFLAVVPFIGMVVVMLLGVSMYLLNSPIQIFFLTVAEADYPQSLILASSLNSIFANFGIALGSATGGIVTEYFGLNKIAPIGSLYVLIALVLTLILERIGKL
ncbi:MFS transporter, partial [Oenococcus oeni]|uniref:MFS transporter n=1 Tax=Oenococcus oeni TaxID=1247 RepID=UPI00164406C5